MALANAHAVLRSSQNLFHETSQSPNFLPGWAVVQDCTFTSNSAVGPGAGGLQIVNMGNIVVNGCTFQQASTVSCWFYVLVTLLGCCCHIHLAVALKACHSQY